MDVKYDLGRFLRDLWNEVASPTVNFLQTTVPPHSRIRWCPTAEFSVLPLHAAGPYRGGQRNISHLYISSYTPTLTTLTRARRDVALAKSSINENCVLAIGQTTANGQSSPFSVGSKLDIVTECMQGLATFMRLECSEPSISRVEEESRKNEWVHLACHGIPGEENPFKAAFALRLRLNASWDASWSTRSLPTSLRDTMVGYKEGPDGVIQLASAMQFAEFRSVIGTMCAVDDAQTNKITSKFYENMLDRSSRLDHT